MTVHLAVEGERITSVEADCNGCPAAQKAAWGLAVFLKGRTLSQAFRLEGPDLEILIGGLPDGKGHYASMAVSALHEALAAVSLEATE